MSKLKEYKAQIRKSFDWLGLIEDCKENKERDESGDLVGTTYLGSVLYLSPSGKYYTPFAHSNVDACPQCHGTGSTKKQYTCEMCGGHGKRFVGDIADNTKEAYDICKARLVANGASFISEYVFECNVCNGTGKVSHSCSRCGGLGSYEAYLDQEWNAALESVAESFGMFVTGSDGDGCDILVGMSFDDDENDVSD